MLFFLKFKHCFYLMSDELFNAQTKPTRAGFYQYFEIVVFLCFSFRLFFIIYLLHADYPDWYDFRRCDMMVHFIYSYSGQLDYVIFILAYLFYLIYFLFEWWCFHLTVCGREWRTWHQLTVMSLNQYVQCRLNESRLQQIKTLKKTKYEERLNQFHLPTGLVKGAASVLASAEIATKMEDVDRKALMELPLPLMPCLSWKMRSKALRLMLFTEYLAYPLQLTIGSLILILFSLNLTYLIVFLFT